jgi:hypothetical protein
MARQATADRPRRRCLADGAGVALDGRHRSPDRPLALHFEFPFRHSRSLAGATILTPAALTLRHTPIADCARYDNLRRTV